MEKLHERGLRFVRCDFNRSYEELFITTNCNTIFIWRLNRNIYTQTFLYHLNPESINNMFNVESNVPYSMRDPYNFDLYKFNTKMYSYNSPMYAGFKKNGTLEMF